MNYSFNGLGMDLGNLSQLSNAVTRSISAENFTGEKGKGGMATEGTGAVHARYLGQGWKMSPSIDIHPGDTFATLRSSQGFEDVWQTHFSTQNARPEDNSPEDFIANLDATPGHIGHYIKISARADGSFTVMNSRNGFEKRYSAN